MDKSIFYLTINARRGERFTVNDGDGKKVGSSPSRFWPSLWNTFLGWLIAVPTSDELTIMDNVLLVESKLRFMDTKYRIVVNHQPVALLTSKNFRGSDLINVKNKRYALKKGLGDTHFTVLADAQTPVVTIQKQLGTADKYQLTISTDFGILTGIGLAIAILAGQGK
ncbi:hypothetical protein [Furfurilactobacillus siliginis]|uniref:Uncharacterized protein n=1 Tax=Furfurilactobacillus siliginis TaxID=348151 RepID=A0A0R2KZH8_9LACO|nr:hypothetical protein [Furfurilactobacillus siliginis]KRN94899.1 hypothetical protein IV55_GL000443 [Furfurilactobacillus siliginis]GEK28476.1 hypothetical protein LSI01_07870 [Furfurilactobacillus siliginis]